MLNKELPPEIQLVLTTDHNNTNLTKQHGYSTHYKKIPNAPRASRKQYKKSFLSKAILEIQPFMFITKKVKNLHLFVSAYKKHIFAKSNN